MSKLVSAILSAAVLSFSLSAMATDAAATTNTVDTACATEMTTTGCKSDNAMGKCFHEFKKKNHEFKVSEGCKKAMKEHHEMKRTS